jgi:hypothetical protein
LRASLNTVKDLIKEFARHDSLTTYQHAKVKGKLCYLCGLCQATIGTRFSVYSRDVFDIEKDFDTIWHSGLLYNLSKLEFSNSLMKLISSFLSQGKFNDSVEGEMSTPRETRAGVPQDSVLSTTLHNIYINDAPQTPGIYLALFIADT